VSTVRIRENRPAVTDTFGPDAATAKELQEENPENEGS